MTQDDKPEVQWDELIASTNFHEVLRCKRGDVTRIYNLRLVPGGAELWRVTESPGEVPQSLKECHFTDADELAEFIEEVRRTLVAGSWQEL